MKEAQFLTFEECLILHAEQMRRFGGSPGLRDPGLLESALARPRSGYYRTSFEQAAALMQSLAMNHCFVDGNKRMAMGCAFIFLDWNGFEIVVSGEAAEKFLLEGIIIGKADVAAISKWLGEHAVAMGKEGTAKTSPGLRHTPAGGKGGKRKPGAAPEKRRGVRPA